MERFAAAFLLVLFPFTFLSAKGRLPGAPDDVPVDARLLQPRGKVTLTVPSEHAVGSAVPNGMPLEEGDVIRTGPRASAQVFISGRTLVYLQENGVLRMKRLSSDNVALTLLSGTLLAKVRFEKKEGVLFSVETVNAVARVTGTELVVEQNGSRTSIGVLDEGHVRVGAPGFRKKVMLHFNQETQVTRDTPPQTAHVLERFYPYKTQMSQMRDRVKVIRKNWTTLSPGERRRLREAWITSHAHPHPGPHRKSH